ncbi:MAG: sulfotransferase [Anaerolineales bacterium]|nr:sulfotransferase [Anaerolineales bacterium]
MKRFVRRVITKAPNVLDLWRFHLRNGAARAGLLRPNRRYTRFIVLGTARTGSNYLRGLLNAHDQVVAFGEVFRHYEEIGWDFSLVPETGAMRRQFQSDPVAFVEQRIYGNFPAHIRAAGFKIFYYHAQQPAWAPLWPHLEAQTDIKVLHVKRRNYLKTLLSRKRAFLTDEWVRRAPGSSQPVGPIAIPYEECLADFTKTRAYEAEFDGRFATHDRYDVMYEDLARNEAAEMRRILAFLGVPEKAVAPSTVKQSKSLPLSQAIANYAALKAQFAGTEWAAFFTD